MSFLSRSTSFGKTHRAPFMTAPAPSSQGESAMVKDLLKLVRSPRSCQKRKRHFPSQLGSKVSPRLEQLETRIVPAVPKPDHVVIVWEENQSYAGIIGQSAAPYINSLAGQGALMTH